MYHFYAKIEKNVDNRGAAARLYRVPKGPSGGTAVLLRTYVPLVLRLVTVVVGRCTHTCGARMSLGETENWRRAAHLGNAMLFAVVYMAAACDRRAGGKSQRSQQKMEQGWTRHAKARMNVPLTVGAGGGFCSAHSAFLLSVSVMGGFGFVFGTYWSMCFEP